MYCRVHIACIFQSIFNDIMEWMRKPLNVQYLIFKASFKGQEAIWKS